MSCSDGIGRISDDGGSGVSCLISATGCSGHDDGIRVVVGSDSGGD